MDPFQIVTKEVFSAYYTVQQRGNVNPLTLCVSDPTVFTEDVMVAIITFYSSLKEHYIDQISAASLSGENDV